MSKKKQYIDSIFFLLIFRLFLNSYFSMLSRIIFLLNSIFNKKCVNLATKEHERSIKKC